MEAPIGQRRIAAGQVKGRNASGAQRHGRVHRCGQFVEPESPHVVHRMGESGLLHDAHGHKIERLDQRFPESRRAVEPFRVVCRPPEPLEIRTGLHDRRVVEDGGYREAAVQCGRIDEGFEGRSRLTPGLGHAVEIA